MSRLINKIQLGRYSYLGCISVTINQSRESYTQTAIIKMPNIFYRQNNKPITSESVTLDNLINKGDIVKIWNGYSKTIEELPLKFRGFISRISVDQEITIHCEDYAYVLKQVNIPSKAFYNATIKDIVSYAIQGVKLKVEYDDEGVQVGDWVIDNNSVVNVLQVLEKLQELGIRVYFKDDILRIGGLTDLGGKTHCHIFEHNIISNDLDYVTGENLVLKGISNLETNEKIEKYAYYFRDKLVVADDAFMGEQRTLNFYNLTAKQLEDNLRNNFNKYIYKGLSGGFQTFLEPFISVNDLVNLYSIKQPYKNGQYKVKSVETEISVNGGFQNIELDYKIRDL